MDYVSYSVQVQPAQPIIVYQSQAQMAADAFFMSGAWIPFVTSMIAAAVVFFAIVNISQNMAKNYFRYDRAYNTVAGLVAIAVFFIVYTLMPNV